MAYVYYNPNPTGRKVGDCAVRAISKALGIDWETAFLMIAKNAYDMGDMPSADSVWGAVTPLAVAITLNGVAIPDSVAIVTPAAAEDVWHIHTSATITVPCGCCVSISAAYVDATEDDATVTPTPSIFVRRNASLTVDRTA